MRFLALILFSLSFLLIYGCNNQSDNVNEPSQPQDYTPDKPYFYQVVATAEEPVRGMYLTINDASDNEDGFRIERKESGGSFSHLVTLSANSKSYTDWGVKTSTKYTYRIQAYNKSGNSEWSEKTQTSAGEQSGTVSFYPDADSFVEEANPTNNNGNSGYLLVYGAYNDPGNQMISYIKFPYQTYIPNYAVYIEKAKLRFVCQNEPANGTALTAVYNIIGSWDENSITWNNRPTPSISASSTGTYVYNNGQPVYFDITSIVRNWLDGTSLNYGFAIIAKNSMSKAVLYSRERSQVKPLLTVDYLW